MVCEFVLVLRECVLVVEVKQLITLPLFVIIGESRLN